MKVHQETNFRNKKQEQQLKKKYTLRRVIFSYHLVEISAFLGIRERERERVERDGRPAPGAGRRRRAGDGNGIHEEASAPLAPLVPNLRRLAVVAG